MLPHGMFSSKTPDWATPQLFFDELNKEFDFTLDPCASKENAKCKKFYTKEEDGLLQDWKGERVFMNPPYGQWISAWVHKAWQEAKTKNILVVALLPARTDTKWFHNYCINESTQIRFLKGRLKFGDSKNSAPFPSMIVVWKG